MHHAFLFTGARGVGKTSAARILAKALSLREGPDGRAVRRVRAVPGDRRRARRSTCIEIDGASNTGVENVRSAARGRPLPARRARRKIYIIDEVHMLSTHAFNALLKTLEEPPAHVVFIFATTEVHKIPVDHPVALPALRLQADLDGAAGRRTSRAC